MAAIYVSIGHGVRSNGTFDPGAVHTVSGATEYDGNRELAGKVTQLLRGKGHEVESESDLANKTDTDYEGSVGLVNARPRALAVDFHQDWEQGSSALCWPLVHPNGTESKRIASQVNTTVSVAGLSTKGPTDRSDLYWLNGTSCPAILIEAGRVGTPRPVDDLAEAIAVGIDIALGGQSVPEPPLPPSEAPGAPPGDETVKTDDAPPWPGVLLSDYTEGHGTAAWQAQMSKRGWAIAVDDAYGSQSAAVCLAFQQEKSLAADGVVGPETWDASFTLPVS